MGATKNISGNALVVKETKGIQAKSIDGFQKLEFWLPDGMTKDDTMLWLSSASNTNLTGTDITAHLRGDETEKRLRSSFAPSSFFSFHARIFLTAQKAQEYNKKAHSARKKTLGWWVLTQSAIPTV